MRYCVGQNGIRPRLKNENILKLESIFMCMTKWFYFYILRQRNLNKLNLRVIGLKNSSKICLQLLADFYQTLKSSLKSVSEIGLFWKVKIFLESTLCIPKNISFEN